MPSRADADRAGLARHPVVGDVDVVTARGQATAGSRGLARPTLLWPVVLLKMHYHLGRCFGRRLCGCHPTPPHPSSVSYVIRDSCRALFHALRNPLAFCWIQSPIPVRETPLDFHPPHNETLSSSRCASAMHIVRPLESIAATQPQLQQALLRLSAMDLQNFTASDV